MVTLVGLTVNTLLASVLVMVTLSVNWSPVTVNVAVAVSPVLHVRLMAVDEVSSTGPGGAMPIIMASP